VSDVRPIERVWRLDRTILATLIERAATTYIRHEGRTKLTAQEMNLSIPDMHWLMRRPEWAALVKKAENERLTRLQYNADDTLRLLIEIAFADPADCYGEHGRLLDLAEIPARTRRCIKSIDYEKNRVVMMDKGTALTILANKDGFNIQRHEVRGADPVEVFLNSLEAHERPPGLERRGINVWESVDAEIVQPSLPSPGGAS
jgi:hypothetical protein